MKIETTVKSRFLLVIINLIGWLTVAYAQNIQFQATCPTEVSLNQRFELEFSINGEGSGFIAPEISGFAVLSGPNLSTNSSVQIINNRISQSVTYNYTYILQATQPGNFTISPATITVGGRKYLSNPIKIHVSGQPQTQPRSSGQKGGGQLQSGEGNISDRDIFMKAVVDKPNPLIGEQILLTYKLYTRIPINFQGVDQIPSYTGFWSQDLLQGKNKYTQYNENFNGSRYVVAEIRKTALFPQQSGKLTIPPLGVDVIGQIKVKSKTTNDDPFFNDPFFKGFFDDAFNTNVQEVRKRVLSNSLTVNVQALPMQGRPQNYTGGVGYFTFTSELDRNKLKANESFTLKLKIQGSGNLNLIDKPIVNLPPDFEVYDPKVSDNINSSPNGISGSRTYEYIVIPRLAGNYKINPISFCYFNLSKKQYVTLTSQLHEVLVMKGDASSDASLNNNGKSDIKYIGNDIRYIHSTPLNLIPIGSNFFGSPGFWLLIIIPLAIFISFVIANRKRLKNNADLYFVRRKKATQVATRRLKTAKQYLSQQLQEPFYNETSQALWGYISDKFSIPFGDLSLDSVNATLQNKNIDNNLVTRFVSVLNDCEFARFAPGDKADLMNRVYKDAIEVITNTEEQLK